MTEERRTETTPVEDEAARLAAKAAKLRKIMLVCAILLGVGLGLLLTRCKPHETPDQRFEAEGFFITLPARFQETGDRSGYDRAYKSNRESVLAIGTSFVGDEQLAAMSAEEFAARQAERNGGSELHSENGIPYFEYSYESGGRRYSCLAAVYKGSESFQLICFVCKSSSYEDYRADFLRFAASVEPK